MIRALSHILSHLIIIFVLGLVSLREIRVHFSLITGSALFVYVQFQMACPPNVMSKEEENEKKQYRTVVKPNKIITKTISNKEREREREKKNGASRHQGGLSSLNVQSYRVSVERLLLFHFSVFFGSDFSTILWVFFLFVRTCVCVLKLWFSQFLALPCTNVCCLFVHFFYFIQIFYSLALFCCSFFLLISFKFSDGLDFVCFGENKTRKKKQTVYYFSFYCYIV